MDSRFPLQLDSIGETLALPHVTASRLVAASEFPNCLTFLGHLAKKVSNTCKQLPKVKTK